MPEAAIAAEPEITTSTTPTESEVAPGLRALFDLKLPSEAGSDTGEHDEPVVEPDAPTPEPEPKPAPKPEEKKAEPAKPPSETRLAPDLSAKKEEPAAAALPEIDMPEEPPAHIKTPKAQEDYRRWRKTTVELQEKVRTLEAAKSAVPAEDPGQQAMIEKLRTENHELLARIERVDLASSPKFQREFVQPRNKLFAEAKTVLKEAGADPEALDQAMGLMGKARIDAFDAIVESIPSQTLRDRFGRLIDGVDAKNREINEALRDARANSEKLTKQETIDRHEAILKQETELKTMLQIARRDLADNAKIPVLHKVDSKEYEWWNKQVDEIDALAEHFMLKATPEMLPKIAYGAAMVDALIDMFNAERRARLAEQKRHTDIDNADPGLGEDKRKPKDSDVADDADIKTAVFARLRSGTT